MNNIFRFFYQLLIITLFWGCNADRLQSNAIKDKKFSRESTKLGVQKLIESFTTKREVNQEGLIIIKGNQGTSVSLNTLNLFYDDGMQAKAPFKFEIIELFTVKDMILANMPTLSDDKLLSTDGELLIKASSNNRKLNYYGNMTITMPSVKADNNMRLFRGQEEINGTINWQPLICNSNFPNERLDSCSLNAKGKEYNFNWPAGLIWINIDKFANYNGELKSVNFTSAHPKVNDITILIYLPQINSISNGQIKLPKGMKATVVAYAYDTDLNIYTFNQDIEIGDINDVVIKLKANTLSAFEAFLKTLKPTE